MIEVDSAVHHGSRADRERDRIRDEALGAAGFTVVRITECEVFTRPWAVVPRVVGAIRSGIPVSCHEKRCDSTAFLTQNVG